MATNQDLIDIYKQEFENKSWFADTSQLKLIEELSFYKEVIEIKFGCNKTLLQKISYAIKSLSHAFCGIYIWGGVGRGKTILLDLFFQSLEIDKKLSIHFHEFMLDFHKELNTLQQQNLSTRRSEDYIEQIATKIARNYKVLCLDELQINNIADAMVVERIFKQLIKCGVFIFFTSNRKPQDLFKDGLQRERFEPFIFLIHNKLLTFNLDSLMDYRLTKLANSKQTYLSPLNPQNNKLLEEIIIDLTGHKNFYSENIFIDHNHYFTVHKACNKIAVFGFNELCELPLGAIEYIAICKNFNTVVIKDIPKLTVENHNEALRFITLIDCMYEHHTRLICSAAVKPQDIYRIGRNQFEFTRTISRLLEMQSAEYIMKMTEAQEKVA